MADDASDTFGGGLKNWLGALGFILPLVGVEEAVRRTVDTQHPSLPYWASGLLIIAGLPIYALPAVAKRVRERSSKNAAKQPEAAAAIEGVPDVRVADDLVVWHLFESASPERDKLYPLLEEDKIQAWGRLGNGHPPLMKIPASYWRTHYISRFADQMVAGRINQTFMKSKDRHETSYYDVCLSGTQLLVYWPSLWSPIPLYKAASLAYGETRGTVISDMAEVRSDSPLYWYVFHFFAVSQIPVYGRRKFSSKREQVPSIKGYAPQLRGEEIILKDIYGDKDWEALSVEPADLMKDLEKLRETAKEVP